MEKSYNLAKQILGDDFISPKEIMKSRKGIVYTDKQFSYFKKTIPSKEILEWCSDNNYMLVAGPNLPMSLLEIYNLKKSYFYLTDGGLMANQNLCIDDKAEIRWYMIRKELIPNSTFKSWEEQKSLISEIEIVPNEAEFVWAVTTYKAVRDIYLFNKIYARTSSLARNGFPVHIGAFDESGLYISNYWNSTSNEDIGLIVSRKK